MLARELKTEMKSEVHRRKMLEGKSLSLVFVSGFYGAGKTAVIKQTLGDVRNQSVRTLVLVNSSHQRTSPELAVVSPFISLSLWDSLRSFLYSGVVMVIIMATTMIT